MRVFTMPLPPLSTLAITIDEGLFAEQYMRYIDKAVSQIEGTRLFYSEVGVSNNRIVCNLNIADLPNLPSVRAKYAEHGFDNRLLAAINKGAQNGIEACPEVSAEALKNSDMRDWADKWISAYLWILLKLDFTNTFNTPMDNNAVFIETLVNQINKQEDIAFNGTMDLSATHLIATHLDPHEYKALAAEFVNAVVAIPNTVTRTALITTRANMNKVYNDVIEVTVDKTHHQEVSLLQQAKRDDCFFKQNKEMIRCKIPMPPLSSLPISIDKDAFAKGVVLMMSRYVRHHADTRMHYKNVEVIGDDIYADINTTRLPQVDWFESEQLAGAFDRDLVDMINSQSDEPVTSDMIKNRDVRDFPDFWIGSFMWLWFKYTLMSWDKLSGNISDDVFVEFIIERVEMDEGDDTIEDVMKYELEALKAEHSMHHHGIYDVLTDVINKIVLEADKSPTRRIDTDFTDNLIDETTDELLDLAAEWLERIRADDEFIKADDYYM